MLLKSENLTLRPFKESDAVRIVDLANNEKISINLRDGEPYWNKGIATSAVNLITQFGFNVMDLVRIHTGVFEYNAASMHVLERCGFVKEGIFRKSVIKF
jgi:RimJ/RimL family protein N-acetyltransferase